jgi:hypothetical protein
MHLSDGSEWTLIVPSPYSFLQDVSAAFYHRHYHYHPRPAHRLYCLGETATVAPRLHSHTTSIFVSLIFAGHSHSFCYIYAVPYRRSLPFPCNPFAARDASIIHAMLSPNGMDIFVVRHSREWTINRFDGCLHNSHRRRPKIVVTYMLCTSPHISFGR